MNKHHKTFFLVMQGCLLILTVVFLMVKDHELAIGMLVMLSGIGFAKECDAWEMGDR